jgi:hypothetical protein
MPICCPSAGCRAGALGEAIAAAEQMMDAYQDLLPVPLDISGQSPQPPASQQQQEQQQLPTAAGSAALQGMHGGKRRGGGSRRGGSRGAGRGSSRLRPPLDYLRGACNAVLREVCLLASLLAHFVCMRAGALRLPIFSFHRLPYSQPWIPQLALLHALISAGGHYQPMLLCGVGPALQC